jgi:hypothetical protein
VLLRFFVVLQVAASPAVQKGRGEEANFGRLLSRRRVNPRAASSGGAWKDAPHCSRAQKPC